MIWLWLPVVIVAVTLILIFVIGFINSRQTSRVYNYLIKDARQRSRRSFTIVVYLGRRFETIVPLLDHLREFNYAKLQVVVVVRQTAGTRAKRSLESYRRRSGMRLSIVKYRRGLSYAVIAARYATGDYMMQIEPTDRLSRRFFDLVSQILYTTNVGALSIRHHLRPRQSFWQAAGSIAYLLGGVAFTFGLKQHKQPSHVIIKRKLVISGKDIKARPYLAEQVHIDMSISETKPQLSLIYLSLSVIFGLILIACFYLINRFAGPYEADVFAVVTLVSLIVCILTLMMSLRGYKLIDYINIFLFLPLLPLYAINRLLSDRVLRKKS